MALRTIFVLLVLVVTAGCARGHGGLSQAAPIRQAIDAPDRFASPASDAEVSDGTCRSPLRDPRTGAALRLVRSVPGLGDYVVPEREYGARAGELLRIDCRTWRVMGFVAR